MLRFSRYYMYPYPTFFNNQQQFINFYINIYYKSAT